MDQEAVPSDLDLLHQAREGEWEAFEELVNRLEPRVFALAMRLLRQTARCRRRHAADVSESA